MACCLRSLRSRVHRQDGLWSWLVCFCASLIAAIIPGLGFSFGALLPNLMRYFSSGRQRTAWIGSLVLALMPLLGPVTGPLCERFGCRKITTLGVVLCATALLVSSFVNQLELLYLTYGVLFGIGDSCVFTGTLLITAKYFTKWRLLALSLVSGGMGAGMLTYGPGLTAALDVVGWKVTFRIIAGVMVLGIVLTLPFDENDKPVGETRDDKGEEDAKTPKQEEHFEGLDQNDKKEPNDNKQVETHKRPKVKLIDCSVWKSPMFTIVTLSATVAFLAEFNPQVHLIKYTEELGIKADTASKLFIYLGVSTLLARPLSGAACSIPWVKPQFVFQIALFGNGLSTLLLPLIKTYPQLIGYVIVYGACDGMYISLLSVLILESVEPKKRASALGLQLFLSAFTTVLGPPGAGLMGDSYGTYKPAFYVGGGISITAGCMVFLLFCFKQNKKTSQSEQVECPEDHVASFSNQCVDETGQLEQVECRPEDHVASFSNQCVHDDADEENTKL